MWTLPPRHYRQQVQAGFYELKEPLIMIGRTGNRSNLPPTVVRASGDVSWA
jgi:hypothetical protein